MKTIFIALLQIIITSGILYGYYHLFLRNNKFHRYNRFYLLGATVVSLIIPFLKIPLYFSKQEADASILYRSLQIINGQEEEIIITSSAFSWADLLTWQTMTVIIYTLITIYVLAKLLLAIYRIVRLRYQYPSAKIENFQFIKTTEPGTPFSFFRWLFWNKKIEVTSEKGQQIFRHEWFHIQQKHSADIIFMEILTVICWFNPFYHLVKRELKTIHEFLADEFAVQHFSKGHYAELLLMQAFETEHKIVNPFFHTQIKRRITMITTSTKPAYQYLRKIMVLPVCALIIALFAFTFKNNDSLPSLLPGEKMIVIIDAGHGGYDDGTIAAAAIFEKDINLQLAKAVAEMNQDPNIEIIMTRESDEYITLQNRTDISANKKADLFISLHVGAAGPLADGKINEKKSGLEVVVSRKNKTFDLQNRALASYMISKFENIHTTNKQILVKETGIWVLDKNNCPSILIECGYLTNPGDLSFITQKENQQQIAKSILAGIHQYAKEKNNLLSTIANQPLNDTIPAKADPLIVIDGKIKEHIKVKEIDPENIQSMNVLKDKKATDKYGVKGKNGVIEITLVNKTKKITVKNKQPKSAMVSKTEIEKALFVIDGKKYPSLSYYQKEAKINELEIKRINVLKGASAVAAYGAEGKNGVIEIISGDQEINNDSKNKNKSVNENKVNINTSSNNRNIINGTIEINNDGSDGKKGFIEFTAETDEPSDLNDLEKSDPIIYLDGVIQVGLKASDYKQKIQTDQIQSINILKGESANNKYGEKGKNGVIEITTKKLETKNIKITNPQKEPTITITELKNKNLHSLLGLTDDVEILSYKMYAPVKTNVLSSENTGGKHNESTIKLINMTSPGDIITIEYILGIKNGKQIKVPAVIFKIIQ